jgi:hypothetical protein
LQIALETKKKTRSTNGTIRRRQNKSDGISGEGAELDNLITISQKGKINENCRCRRLSFKITRYTNAPSPLFLTFIVMSDIVIRRVLEASFAPVLITQWHDDDDEETLFFDVLPDSGAWQQDKVSA